MKIKKKIGIIMVAIFATFNLISGTMIYAADSRIPFVHISRPSANTVAPGGSISYNIWADNASSFDIVKSKLLKAGNGVTFDLSISSSGDTKIVTLSNIQGPNDKLVSIAAEAGCASNEFGASLRTAKSVAFRIVYPVPEPAPAPAPGQSGGSGNNSRPNVKPNTSSNKIPNSQINNNTNGSVTPENTTPEVPVDANDTTAPVINISAPNILKIQSGENVEYTVNFTDNVGVKEINLIPENIKTYGFKADISITGEGTAQRVIHLNNITGSLGGQKYIKIESGICIDGNGNKSEGVKKSEAFMLYNKATENKASNWIQNPNTGI
ncbi:MAG: hypothetical protein RSE00_00520 [Clostridia bacterium]